MFHSLSFTVYFVFTLKIFQQVNVTRMLHYFFVHSFILFFCTARLIIIMYLFLLQCFRWPLYAELYICFLLLYSVKRSDVTR